MIEIKKYRIYLANLNPSYREYPAEPGKIRPIVVIQTNLLNPFHSSTIICPITTNLVQNVSLTRVRLEQNSMPGLDKDSDILVDQIRTIDNRRFIKQVGELSQAQIDMLKENLKYMIIDD